MTAASRGSVELTFGDGTTIADWETFELRETYTDPLGSFEFTAHPPKEKRDLYRELCKRGELVTLHIDGHPQATPIITRVQKRLGKQGLSYRVTCRSVLATAFQGCVDPDLTVNLTADAPVGDLVVRALEPFGFDIIITDTSANVSAKTGKPLDGRKAAVTLDELKDKDAQVSPGETAYQFARRMFSRHGLALHVSVEGILMLGSPDYDQQSAYALHHSRDLRPGSTRMMGDVTVTESNDGQYSHCVVEGRSPDKRGATRASAPQAGARWTGTTVKGYGEKVAFKDLPTGPHAYVSSVAGHKPLYAFDKKARDVPRAESWAGRMIAGSAEEAYTIECAVDGLLAHNGAVWTVDTMADVYIEDDEVDGAFWIYETVKRADRKGGQSTSLVMLPPHSLVLSTDP